MQGRPRNKYEWNQQQRQQVVDQAIEKGISPSDGVKMRGAVKAIVTKERLKDELVQNGGVVSRAAKAVGVSANYARKLMPEIRTELIEEFENAGATPQKVAEVVVSAMEAEKPAKQGGGPDHRTRLRAVDKWLNVTGAVAPSRNINTNVPATNPDLEPVEVLKRFRALREFDDIEDADLVN